MPHMLTFTFGAAFTLGGRLPEVKVDCGR